MLAELIADVAPAKHVELLFERAKRLRKAGKPVEAFGSLKPLLRSRADLDAAIDDDQRFFLAQLSLEAVGEGLVRSTRADDPVFEQFAVLAAKGYPVAKKLARNERHHRRDLYALGFRLIESGDGSNEELGAELLAGHHRRAPAQQAREGGEEQAQAHRPPRRRLATTRRDVNRRTRLQRQLPASGALRSENAVRIVRDAAGAYAMRRMVVGA